MTGRACRPLAQTLAGYNEYRFTLADTRADRQPHVHASTANITWLQALNLGKALVHIIDREGGSSRAYAGAEHTGFILAYPR